MKTEIIVRIDMKRGLAIALTVFGCLLIIGFGIAAFMF